MEQIDKYQIHKELLKFNNNISLWLAEPTDGTPVELLAIKKNPEYQTLLDRLLRNEILTTVNLNQEGIQKCLDADYDSVNDVYFIVYEELKNEISPNFFYTLTNLKSIISSLEKLKIQNRFCHIWSLNTFPIKEIGVKMRFLGLFELFKQQNLLEDQFVAPELKNWIEDNKSPRPNFQSDIFSLFKLFEPLRVNANDPELDKIFSKATTEKRTERYSRYSEILDELSKIKIQIKPDTNKRLSIKVKTKPEDKEKLNPILIEMTNECFVLIEKDLSDGQAQITGQFSTKNYSGRFFVDSKNHIFIPIVSCKNIAFTKVVKEGFIIEYGFDFEPSVYFDTYSFFQNKWSELNTLAQLNSEKVNLVKKWQTLPEKEMEFVEETAFKATYIKREQSKSTNTNTIFTLTDKFREWTKFSELKQNQIELSIDNKIIGKIHDYNVKTSILVIKDAKTTIDEIPETGELIQDVRKETSQFKKQVEAVKKFEKKIIVNPELTSIITTPERIDEKHRLSIFESDYENFKEEVINENLKADNTQRESVFEALHYKPIYLIQGPPGTGKTTVIVELIQQILKQKKDAKILVTSQSNLAVDNVLERLPESVLFMRLAVDEERISSEKIKKHSFQSKLKKWVQETQDRSEKHFNSLFGDTSKDKALISFLNFYSNINKGDKDSYKNLQSLLNYQNQYVKELFINAKSFKEFESIFAQKLGKDFQKFKKLQKEWFAFLSNAETDEGEKKKSMLNDGSIEIDLKTAFVKSVNVIGATCIHIASGQYNKINFKFDYVIMDESSKASPAETLVPINMGQNIVLIGDHKQLPPVITREEAVRKKVKEELDDNGLDIENTFGESLFEKLITSFEENPNLQNNIKMLDIQYRMPRQIGNIISRFFYKEELKNPDINILTSYDQDKSHGLKFKKQFVTIYDAQSKSEMEVPTSAVFVSTSQRENPSDNNNLLERNNDCNRKAIEEILAELNKVYSGNSKKKDPFTIGIIAGYRGQVNLLKEKVNIHKYKNFEVLNKEGRSESLIEINTVDKFQGAERDIIIYDVVRSSKGESNIGFLDDYRRINVALSRVKRLLIVVGDSEYLMKRATLNPNSKFNDFKLQEIVKELERQGVIVNDLKDILE